MRPPDCELCDARFDPGDGGGLVSFARDPAHADWYIRAEQPGFIGHPPHQAWFCAAHRPAATTLANRGQTLAQAKRELRLVALALATGAAAMRPGDVRVLCLGDGVAPFCHDFASVAEAQAYADDVASEADHGPIATILTDGAVVLGRGRAFGS